jgi:hypothetical protein
MLSIIRTSLRLRFVSITLSILTLGSGIVGCELAVPFGDYQQATDASSLADGGADGGGRDAGARDTGTSDAATSDAGGRDAGLGDAAMADMGGTNDASFDAGAPDSPTDAGPVQHHVSVTITGGGAGMVSAMGGALTCSSGTCSWSVDDGTTLVIHPAPGSTSTLTSWGGACSATAATTDCSLTVTADAALTATFDIQRVNLTVVIANPPGTVMVAGGGSTSSCDQTSSPCVTMVNVGTTVTLTATPVSPNTEVAWSVGTCSGNTCMVTVNADTMVTATFADGRPVLNVNMTGHGTVADSTIACVNGAGTCMGVYPINSSVTLTETPETGWTFMGWTGCDSTTATTCTILLTAHAHPTVTANFGLTVTVSIPSSAGGTVSSTDTGPTLSCPGTCSHTYAAGTSLTLVASPAGGYLFTGWSGVTGCSNNTTCTFTVNAATTATANFARPVTLTINLPGVNAGGSQVLVPGGLSCTQQGGAPTQCSFPVAPGPMVLRAQGSPGYFGAIWSISGCTGESCAINITTPMTVGVTWAPLGNLGFVTSATYSAIFGPDETTAHTNANAICRARASAGGLPNGNYFAWLSSANVDANASLGSDQIYVRPDGLPIATTQSQLLSGQLINPIMIDENGAVQTGNAWTSTMYAGWLDSGHSCNNWTANGGGTSLGTMTTTGQTWTSSSVSTNCLGMMHLYCFQTGGSGFAPIGAAFPPDAVRIFTSSVTAPGSTPVATMDARCQADATAASLPGTYVAFVSTSTTPAFSRATMFGTLTRADGWVVGPHGLTASVLAAPPPQGSAVFAVHADRSLVNLFPPVLAWTGMGATSMTASMTCSDWSTTSGTGGAGDPSFATTANWAGLQQQSCTESHPWYCIQTGP